MREFFKNLLRGPKYWSQGHSAFLFFVFGGAFAVIFASWMVPDPRLLEPRYAGVVQSIQKSRDGGVIYSEINTDLNVLFLNEELAVNKGDSLFFLPTASGVGVRLICDRNSDNCAQPMKNGILSRGNM